MALASGTAEEALAGKRGLLNIVREDAELTSWQRNCSYRVVGRAELEELVRVTHAEEAETKRREQKTLEEAARTEEAGEGDEAAEAEEEEEKERVAVTPPLLALAFQLLVGQDRRAFLAHEQQQTDEGGGGQETHTEEKEVADSENNEERSTDPTQTPARVYLLVDYPSSLLEIDALLRLGEVGCASQVTDGPEKLPLLPLIDGMVLLADPLGVSGRNRKNSINLPRNRGGSVVKANSSSSGMSMTEPSVFQTSNAVVKTFYEAAQVGGVEWSDFTFTNVGCRTEASVIKQPEELEQELVNTVETIAATKFAFKNWVATTKFSAIPSTVGNDDALYEKYKSILSGVSSGSVRVSTVLFAVAEAVSTVSLPLVTPSLSYNASHNTQADSFQFEEFVEHGDLVACRFAVAQLCHEALHAEGNPSFLPRRNHRLDDVERFMWRQSDLPGVGNEGRKAMPRVPELSKPERSVRNTELATFYESPRLSCWVVHLTRQLLQVEEILGSSWRGKLQPRAFLENLTRAVLPQRITFVLQQNTPDIYSSYYAPTDSLLLACLPKTAPGRMQSSSWVASDHVRHRSAFKDWKREQLISQEYLTPRTEAAACACVPLSAGQLALVANQTWSMYPADHSVVRLYQTPRGLVWLTVYHHGCVHILFTHVLFLL